MLHTPLVSRPGTFLCFFCCRMLIELSERGIDWSLEQPATSRMWICRAMLRALHRTGAQLFNTVFCAWGKRWMKRTRFAFSGVPSLSRLASNCSCTNGFRDYSKQKHIRLEGTAPGGANWTLVAQPYPKALCAKFAEIVSKHHIYLYIDCLDRSTTTRLSLPNPP